MSYAIVMEKPLWYEPEDLLREKLERVGLDPDEAERVYLFNERSPSATSLSAIKEQLPRVVEELRGVDAALLLGGPALQAIGGQTSITKNRGALKALRKETKDLEHVSFLSTLHPSVVLRTQNYIAGWVKDLAAFQQLVNPPVDNDIVIQVDDTNSLDALLDAMEGATKGALDIETTVADNEQFWNNQMVSMAMCFDDTTCYVLTYTHPESPEFDWGAERLERFRRQFNKVEWIMHNGLFDRLLLRELTKGQLNPILKHDTMAMAYLLHEDERKGLEILSSVYLGEPPYKGIDYMKILEEPLSEIVLMNGKDTLRTFRLFRPLADELNENKQLSRVYQWLLMPAVNALIDVTLNGVPVDRDRLTALTATKEQAEADALVRLQELAPTPSPDVYPDGWPKHKDPAKSLKLNPASTAQMRHVLYDLFHMPVTNQTDTGAPSTDAETLTSMAGYTDPATPEGEFISALLDYRGLSKQVSSYLHSWPKLWRTEGKVTKLHPRYKPLHVATGRLSSQHPNIQQVPRVKEYRRIFGGVEGFKWVKADYSQLELRVAAWLADEKRMLSAYNTGEDLHALTAQLVLGVNDVTQEFKPGTTARDVGKTLNFGLLYGAYPKRLQSIARMNYGVFLSLTEAEQYRERFFDAYPGLGRWHKKIERQIRRDCMIASPLGRIRHFPDAGSDEFSVWSKAVREGTNHPVQSFGSDLMMMSLTRINTMFQEREVAGQVVATVHDEVDLLVRNKDADRAVVRVKEIMEDTSWLGRFGVQIGFPVVADVEIGEYWGEVS